MDLGFTASYPTPVARTEGESAGGEGRPQHDPKCYLCPGNDRAGGAKNPKYADTYVFRNDYSALLPHPSTEVPASKLITCEPVQGECRVICFSPRHDLTLPEMEVSDIEKVVELWADQVTELGGRYGWVQVFENKGAVMGCSNPHPHGQIWVSNFIPKSPGQEDHAQREYGQKHSSPLLVDYLKEELEV